MHRIFNIRDIITISPPVLLFIATAIILKLIIAILSVMEKCQGADKVLCCSANSLSPCSSVMVSSGLVG